MTLAGIINIGWAEGFFVAGAILLTVKICLSRELRAKHHVERRIITGVVLAVLGSISIYVCRLLEAKKPKPSFVYVHPGVLDEQRGVRFFHVAHKGPDIAFKVEGLLSDFNERYRNRTFVGEEVRRTTASFAFDEIGPVPRIVPFSTGFAFAPASPGREEYWITIAHRSGFLLERLLIQKRSGDWAYAIYVVDQHTPSPPLLVCQDPGFQGELFFNRKKPTCAEALKP